MSTWHQLNLNRFSSHLHLQRRISSPSSGQLFSLLTPKTSRDGRRESHFSGSHGRSSLSGGDACALWRPYCEWRHGRAAGGGENFFWVDVDGIEAVQFWGQKEVFCFCLRIFDWPPDGGFDQKGFEIWLLTFRPAFQVDFWQYLGRFVSQTHSFSSRSLKQGFNVSWAFLVARIWVVFFKFCHYWTGDMCFYKIIQIQYMLE